MQGSVWTRGAEINPLTLHLMDNLLSAGVISATLYLYFILTHSHIQYSVLLPQRLTRAQNVY